jgi:alpha-galactosidase
MRLILIALLFFRSAISFCQPLAVTPPMGWMTWNYFGKSITEKDIREMADAMDSSGMAKAGYRYIIIDDGWQGGRDKKNNIIPDPEKFPSGIKALADYVHAKGFLLGIYSDAAPLTCGGFTASLNFEEQDAATFANWGIDYVKYDYCGAPNIVVEAQDRYRKMSDAIRKSGRPMLFSVCEWGDRQPWLWAAAVGGQLWRTTYDVKDKWIKRPQEKRGEGIIDNLDKNARLYQYAGPGRWNDPDMLVVGLYGHQGPSGDLGGYGCTSNEYQSQMSLWCMMAAPLLASNDLRNMDADTKRILMNPEVIAIDQDSLGVQAKKIVDKDDWNVFFRPLANGDYAVAILNREAEERTYKINWSDIGLCGKRALRDIWLHKDIGCTTYWQGSIGPHETKLFRLTKQ